VTQSFLLSHIALSGLPLAIFIIFVVTIAVFAIVVALLLALLVAVLFIVVMAGFALVILFPILFFTTFVAVAVWLWGMAAYYILKWFNKTDIPGIHTDFKGGVSDEVKGALGGLGLGGGEGGLGAITGGGMGTPDAKPQQNGSAQKEPVHSKSSGRDGSENGSAQKLPSRGGGQNPASNVTNKAGDVQKQLGGVTNKAGAAGGALNSAKGQIPGLG